MATRIKRLVLIGLAALVLGLAVGNTPGGDLWGPAGAAAGAKGDLTKDPAGES